MSPQRERNEILEEGIYLKNNGDKFSRIKRKKINNSDWKPPESAKGEK